MNKENRYIVIKRKDLANVRADIRIALTEALIDMKPYLPQREFLVIESDWPEFNPAWESITNRSN